MVQEWTEVGLQVKLKPPFIVSPLSYDAKNASVVPDLPTYIPKML